MYLSSFNGWFQDFLQKTLSELCTVNCMVCLWSLAAVSTLCSKLSGSGCGHSAFLQIWVIKLGRWKIRDIWLATSCDRLLHGICLSSHRTSLPCKIELSVQSSQLWVSSSFCHRLPLPIAMPTRQRCLESRSSYALNNKGGALCVLGEMVCDQVA